MIGKVNEVDKYTENLCGQCWNCANRIGEGVYSVKINGKKTLARLPRCKATDKFMTEVYSIPSDVQAKFGFNTPQAIFKWMRGDAVPTIDNLVILADILDMPIDKIIIVTRV